MEKGLWLVKHTRTLLSSGLRLIVVVHPNFLAPLACSFPSSRLRSQIKDRAGVLTHVRYDAVADGPLRFVRSLARCSSYLFSSFCPFIPSFVRPSHSIFPCSYLPAGIVKIPVRGIRECERKREKTPIVKVVVARRAVRSFHVLPRARARARDCLPLSVTFSSSSRSAFPCPLLPSRWPGRISCLVLPSSSHIIRVHAPARHDTPVTFYFPRDHKRANSRDWIFEVAAGRENERERGGGKDTIRRVPSRRILRSHELQ